MTSSQTRQRIPAFAMSAISGLVTSLGASVAFASQGPGGGPGTASGFTQLAMAIIVYGTSALVVGTGLVGAARRRH
jgi:hypothetical protein